MDDIHVKEVELVCRIVSNFFQFLCRDILVCLKLHLDDVVVPDNSVKDNESTRAMLFCSSNQSADIDILFLDRNQTFTRLSVPYILFVQTTNAHTQALHHDRASEDFSLPIPGVLFSSGNH